MVVMLVEQVFNMNLGRVMGDIIMNIKIIIILITISIIGGIAISYNNITSQNSLMTNQTVKYIQANNPTPKKIVELYPPQIVLPRTQSVYGNLTNYSVVLNCTIPNYITTAPLLVQYNASATESQAKEIAEKIFGMKNVTVLEPMYRGEITLATEDLGQILEVHSLNTLFYSNPSSNVEKSNGSIREIADDFTKKLDEYLIFDTDITRNCSSIQPSGWSTETSLNGTIISTKITSYSVGYSYYIDKVPIVGGAASFCYFFQGKTIDMAKLRIPIVKIAGVQNVTVTPSQALQNFISGWGVSSNIVPTTLTGFLPETGRCIVNRVRLVYYSDWSFKKQYSHYPVLLYEISGKLEYLENGKEVSEPFTTYEYTTG